VTVGGVGGGFTFLAVDIEALADLAEQLRGVRAVGFSWDQAGGGGGQLVRMGEKRV
jgi:hypothetical protein